MLGPGLRLWPAAWRRFINALGLINYAVSLGDAGPLVPDQAGITHRVYGGAGRARFGIEEDLLCIAVGLEDAADLLADIDQAPKPF